MSDRGVCMSVYAVSDLHGCKTEFDRLLNRISFTDYDEMYIIGDVGDRGKEPIPLFQEILSRPNMHLIFGNHDQWLRRYIAELIEEKRNPGSIYMNTDLFNWLHNNGGLQTMDQFLSLDITECYDLQYRLENPEFYKYVEVNGQRFLLVHAGLGSYCFAGIHPAEVPVDELIWSHIGLDDNPFPDTTMVVGHMPTFFYGPEYDGQIIWHEKSRLMHIDCGCVYGRALGCVRLDDLQFFYEPSTYPYIKF